MLISAANMIHPHTQYFKAHDELQLPTPESSPTCTRSPQNCRCSR